MKYVKRIIIALFVLGVSLIVFAFCFYKYNLTSVSNDTTDKVITINEGTITSIAKTLKDNNLIRNELIFKLYIKIHNINNLKASVYNLNESMSLDEIVNILSDGNSYNPDAISITFKEGKNMRYIATTISENTNNTYDEVLNKLEDTEYIDSLIDKYWFLTDDIKNSKIYYPLEGYLFPETYYFLNDEVTIEEIFKTMLDETDKRLSQYKDEILELDLTIHEYFTLASIVDLEGASADDKEAVAGVFYNRLNNNWSLGSDVTTYYYLKIDDFKVSLNGDLGLYKCDYAYNTRCNDFIGLPVGPICNPSIESFLAVLNPKEHDYFYFVADCSGKTYLSKNSYEHNSIINKLVNENNWCG